MKNTGGGVGLFDGWTLEQRDRFSGRGHDEGAEIRFTASGTMLVDGSWEGRLLVREVSTGEVVWEEFEPGAMIASLTCYPRSRAMGLHAREGVRRRGPGSSVAVLGEPSGAHHPDIDK